MAWPAATRSPIWTESCSRLPPTLKLSRDSAPARETPLTIRVRAPEPSSTIWVRIGRSTFSGGGGGSEQPPRTSASPSRVVIGGGDDRVIAASVGGGR